MSRHKVQSVKLSSRPRSDDRTAHFALRIPRITRVEGQNIDTIEAHNEVAKKFGQVALAKFGKAGANTRFEMLLHQIESGSETLLILITKQGDHFLGYQSPLSSIYRGNPTAIIRRAMPAYYSKLDQIGTLWFSVDSPFTRVDLTKFRLLTNRRPLLEVISTCRTPSMLVERHP
jgi:hypothetical protein